MSIEIGSKWVKDGEVVEVVSNFHFTLEDEHEKNYGIDLFSSCTVWFFVAEKVSVLTERDFLEQYKHYEPVYEYRFMYQLNDINFGEWHLHPVFYQTVEDCINYTTRNAYNFQRLDFTKRERKQ